MLADQNKRGGSLEDDGPALLQSCPVGHHDREIRVVVFRRAGVANQKIRPVICPGTLVEQRTIAGPQVTDDHGAGYQGIRRLIVVTEGPCQGYAARDLHIGGQAHILNPVNHGQRLHIAGQVQGAGQGHHPAVHVDAVELRRQLLAVLVLHPAIGQPFAPGVELLTGLHSHREGAALGGMHHHDVPLANKGHPAIRWQPHRIQLDQIRIERQIAIDHRIKPDGVSHHRQGAPDLAIDHPIRVVPGFTLIARCRHQAAKAHRYHPGLIVHLAGYILAGDGAIAVGGHLKPAPICGVAAQVEAGWGNRCPRRPECHLVHRLGHQAGDQRTQGRHGRRARVPDRDGRLAGGVIQCPGLLTGSGGGVDVAIEDPLPVHIDRPAQGKAH